LAYLSGHSFSFAFLDLNLSGQLGAEVHAIGNYTLAYPKAEGAEGGYQIPVGDSQHTSLEILFFKLFPHLYINDNISIWLEMMLGSSTLGLRSYPQAEFLKFMRFWSELVTHIGVFQLGRVPLDWGLGLVWNNGKYYPTTGDGIRWIIQFGFFTFIPSLILCNLENVSDSGEKLTETSMILQYENPESEIKIGINWLIKNDLKKTDLSIYDVYAYKKIQAFSLGLEVPVLKGQKQDIQVQTWSIAGEMQWNFNKILEFLIQTGYASGQSNHQDQALSKIDQFIFHPSYQIGNLLFHYRLRNFGKTSGSKNLVETDSPFCEPISNAIYFNFGTKIYPNERWMIYPHILFAFADQAAKKGKYFFHHWEQESFQAQVDQKYFLGWEFGLGVQFDWDDHAKFSWHNGIFFPGGFYKFNNTTQPNSVSPALASVLQLSIQF